MSRGRAVLDTAADLDPHALDPHERERDAGAGRSE
jgi:hypothetical protein